MDLVSHFSVLDLLNVCSQRFIVPNRADVLVRLQFIRLFTMDMIDIS